MNKYITIIPARGGSVRLPKKNILELNGMPLIAYSILYSKKYLPQSEVYVSTDSSEIAAISKKYGAKIINRPLELSSDKTSTAEVLKHAAEILAGDGIVYDYMVLLQATNPLRPDSLMSDAIKIIEENDVDSLFTVSPSDRKLGRIKDHTFIPWNYSFGQRSQDMEPLYYENGLLYITRKDIILSGKIVGNNMFPLIVDHVFGTIDIDTVDDFKLAAYFMSRENDV